MKQYYKILNVKNSASFNDITRAYNAPKQGASEATELQEAYATLSDPKKREAYDAELLKNTKLAQALRSTYENIKERKESLTQALTSAVSEDEKDNIQLSLNIINSLGALVPIAEEADRLDDKKNAGTLTSDEKKLLETKNKELLDTAGELATVLKKDPKVSANINTNKTALQHQDLLEEFENFATVLKSKVWMLDEKSWNPIAMASVLGLKAMGKEFADKVRALVSLADFGSKVALKKKRDALEESIKKALDEKPEKPVVEVISADIATATLVTADIKTDTLPVVEVESIPLTQPHVLNNNAVDIVKKDLHIKLQTIDQLKDDNEKLDMERQALEGAFCILESELKSVYTHLERLSQALHHYRDTSPHLETFLKAIKADKEFNSLPSSLKEAINTYTLQEENLLDALGHWMGVTETPVVQACDDFQERIKLIKNELSTSETEQTEIEKAIQNICIKQEHNNQAIIRLNKEAVNLHDQLHPTAVAYPVNNNQQETNRETIYIHDAKPVENYVNQSYREALTGFLTEQVKRIQGDMLNQMFSKKSNEKIDKISQLIKAIGSQKQSFTPEILDKQVRDALSISRYENKQTTAIKQYDNFLTQYKDSAKTGLSPLNGILKKSDHVDVKKTEKSVSINEEANQIHRY